MKDILKKLDELHKEEKYQEILDYILTLEAQDDKYKNDYDVIGHKARALNNLERTEEARRELLKVEEEGKNDKIWNYRVAYSYWWEEKNEGTLKYAERSLELTKSENNPDDEELLKDTIYMLAWAYNRFGKYEDAYKLLLEHPNEEDGSWNLEVAENFLRANKFEESEEYFKKAKLTISEDDNNLEYIVEKLFFLYTILEKRDKIEKLSEEYPDICDKITSFVYDYDKDEKETLFEFLQSHFGEYEIIKDEEEGFPKIDLAVFKPTEKRNNYIISTIGMGYVVNQNMPQELLDQRYGRMEFLVALPSDWDIYSEEEEYSWPLEWLKLLAKWPFRSDVWLWWGHTIPCGSPFAKNTKLFCMFLTNPTEYAEDFSVTLNNGDIVTFLQLLPIYEEEMEYKLKYGAEGLLKLFGENFSNVINIKRKNYALRYGLPGSNKNKWSNKK